MQISRRGFLLTSAAATAASAQTKPVSIRTHEAHSDTRAAWVAALAKTSEPVLRHMAAGTLQKAMPVELSPGGKPDRAVCTHLEAFGRLLSGIATWLEGEDTPTTSVLERTLRTNYRALVLEGLARGVDPNDHGYLRFGEHHQTLVDSSFLALGLLRASKQLIETLSAKTKQQLIDALVKERKIRPGMNNWLLFSAMNEALLYKLGAEWKREPVEFALNKHREWYKGDGTYGDGAHFHWDYYNSFVIQPYLLQIADTLGAEFPDYADFFAAEKLRAARYATVQERLIAPDGTYPVVGRSIAYRCGAFHLLADVARREMLPPQLRPNQVRSALSAVIQKTLAAPNTFDKKGWLQIGLSGHQPALGETYISTGSLYLCSEVFLPLGLSASHVFWSGPSVQWTSQKVWNGENFPADHSMDK
ncbi:MAG: DUF2264 domain-containing protein [Acidobacteria bacterium]|nr:DUF2264 domain-containing protein [Acidobacteriota bacterium]